MIIQILRSRRSYLNGITEEGELCPVCSNPMMQKHVDTWTHHNPGDCLRRACITLTELGEQWEIDCGGSNELVPISVCAGGEHTHTNWQEYKECYGKVQKKLNCHRELRMIRGAKTHELCRKCIYIFVAHTEAQCPMDPEQVNSSLLDLWESPTVDFVRLVGTMAKHARKIQQGPCPLCKAQEEWHDYAMCLRTAKITRERGMLNIMTAQRHTRGSAPDPVPTGPTPGTTPGEAPKTSVREPEVKSPKEGTEGENHLVKG